MGFLLLDDGSSGGPQPLAGTSTATATVSAGLAVAKALSATVTGAAIASTPTGKPAVAKRLQATSTGVAVVTAQFGGDRQLSGTITGTAVVTNAPLPVAKGLRSTVDGVSVVSASLFVEGMKATATGICSVSVSLAVNRRMSAMVNGVAEVSTPPIAVLRGLRATSNPSSTVVAFVTKQTPMTATVNGVCGVSATLGRIFRRSATSNLSISSEYQRIVGILMLVDPAFQIELSTPPTAQTFTFVKKVVKGLFYVDIQVAGANLICQVKTGDGQNYNSIVDVSVRTISSGILPAIIAVTTGTLKAAGAGACWLQTTSSGAFAVTITGATGDILAEAFPKQGVIMSAGLTI